MKKQFLLGLICLSLHLLVFSQIPKKTLYDGIWTEKNNGNSELKWIFHSNGSFNQIAFWNNGVQVGGSTNSGRFNYDKNSNALILNFHQYSLMVNDSIILGNTEKKIEWKLKSITENEIVINRPVEKETEKKLKSYDGKNVDIVLTREVKLPY